MNPVSIIHFSDVLCIWAYVAQIRMDELQSEFGEQVNLDYHFMPLFADTETLINNNFGDRGLQGINQAAQKVAAGFDHVEVHPELWLNDPPASSSNAHLFLKAIQLLDQQNPESTDLARQVDAAAWNVRQAFFRDGLNISKQTVLLEIAKQMTLPVETIEEKLVNGEAHAAINRDLVLQQKHQVTGSPTLIFNEGRQTIYGNVGYRVIEANIRELLHRPDPQCSWC